MTGDKFITICKEGESVLSANQIWQTSVKEKLEDIIENFLETGYLEYTTIPFNLNEKPKKITKKLYPEINKICLFEQIGRFRKREKEIGGNIRNMKGV